MSSESQVRTVTREELFNQVWKTPIRTLASEYGVSDVAVAKACKRLNVPRPPRGYWAKVAAGKGIPKPNLPPLAAGAPDSTVINPFNSIFHPKPDEVPELGMQTIRVPETLHGCHPLVSATKKCLESCKPGENRLLKSSDDGTLSLSVSKASMHRALRLMEALIRAAEANGWRFSGQGEREWMKVRTSEEDVSLLLWAGADPRLVVPDMENSPPEEFAGTALEDAVRYGKLDVVRKIGIDPKRDDLTALLAASRGGSAPEIVKILLAAGVDPNGFSGEESPMQSFMCSFGWSLDSSFLPSNPDPIIACIEILASHGGRWRPKDAYEISSLRRALGRAKPYDAVRGLERIIKSGAIEKDVFLELMRTPKMRLLISSGHPGSVFLRECSGQIEEPPRKPTTRGRRRS